MRIQGVGRVFVGAGVAVALAGCAASDRSLTVPSGAVSVKPIVGSAVPAWGGQTILPGGGHRIQREPVLSIDSTGGLVGTFMDITSYNGRIGDLITVRSANGGASWSVDPRIQGALADPEHVQVGGRIVVRGANLAGGKRSTFVEKPSAATPEGSSEAELFVKVPDPQTGVLYRLYNTEPPFNLYFQASGHPTNGTIRVISTNRAFFGHMVFTHLRTLVAAWIEEGSQLGTYELVVARSRDEGSIFTRGILSASPDPVSRPQLALDPNGTVHLLWYEREGDGTIAVRYARSSDDGVQFAGPETVVSGMPYDLNLIDYNALAADSSHVYAAWNDSRLGNGKVRIAFASRENR